MSVPYWEQQPGVAPIKPEYVLWDKIKSDRPVNVIDDDAAEGRTSHGLPQRDGEVAKEEAQQVSGDAMAVDAGSEEPTPKKQRLSGAQKKALARERSAAQKAERQEKKRGQNKARKFDSRAGAEEIKLCHSIAAGRPCERQAKGQTCNLSHDLQAYLDIRPPDVVRALPATDDDLSPTTSAAPCPIFAEKGECFYGFRCLFSASHLREVEPGKGAFGTKYELVVDNDKKDRLQREGKFDERNFVGMDTIKATRTGSLKGTDPIFAGSRKYLEEIGELVDAREANNKRKDGDSKGVYVVGEDADAAPVASTSKDTQPDFALIRPSERKRLDFKGKLYLAPLTTVGNLPFRRLCNSLGNDITCSEMGLATEYLNGSKSEWSLVRRHHSEKMFGVQICGSRPQALVPAAEAIVKSCDIDFMDINCGCPIDLVFNKGGGSALMAHASRLGKSIVGMDKVLGDIPVTIKIRTGVAANQPLAHRLAPRAQNEWGASAVTLHGRSRQQRYKLKADYGYIGQVAQAMRDAAAEVDIEPIPFFANGDAYDWKSYYENVEATGVDGIMIARGALIKPWIFTEIKERRDWDISSRERLDMIGQLANYGLEHWGSDTMGINTTRRFLCEALSFTHRYVPVGLLERQMGMNERPLQYRGRDELETLLASPSSEDWVKISNMFLGPPPEQWHFTPKHKANSTESSVGTEVQG